jgi:hypothetical protein
MLFAAAVLLTVGAVAYTLFVREKDIPPPEAATGYEHLEERRARIYDNLRDLQFEYRVGKLSEADYQSTKQSLQAELAGVLAEIDKLKGGRAPAPSPVKKPPTQCPHCGTKFPVPMKFCGNCGKAMS